MKNSRDIQRLQKTQYRDCSVEDTVEPENKQRVHRVPSAFKNGRTCAKQGKEISFEDILKKANVREALKRVKKNKGKPGIDKMTVDELPEFLNKNWKTLKSDILTGKYKPKPVRRVEIPKPNGGIRLLGIPTVLDRVIQQAIAQKLNEIFDPTFSQNSFGFRPKKSAKDAIKKAQEYMDQGNRWVVDIDLEKFFDKVNHDKLMARIARKIEDKRILKLIRLYLQSGIMINGVIIQSEEGTPQGGPLSPLLANIILDDLDKELEKRGHKFCRYADDCNVYVKSKRAGERVMKSITQYVENILSLKVNINKSAVDRPWRRKFLGFSFYMNRGKIRVRIAPQSVKKFKDKIKTITNRNYSISLENRLKKLKEKSVGWINYFGITDAKGVTKELDEWIRRRLRMCIWKQWKKVKTRYRNLKSLGLNHFQAIKYANTRKGYWRISNSPILSRTLTNQFFKEIGYHSLSAKYLEVHNS